MSSPKKKREKFNKLIKYNERLNYLKKKEREKKYHSEAFLKETKNTKLEYHVFQKYIVVLKILVII